MSEEDGTAFVLCLLTEAGETHAELCGNGLLCVAQPALGVHADSHFVPSPFLDAGVRRARLRPLYSPEEGSQSGHFRGVRLRGKLGVAGSVGSTSS